MDKQYLILSADGARPILYAVDRAGLEGYLAEATEQVAAGCPEPVFLTGIPHVNDYVEPGSWPEGRKLILEVKAVVPQSVTTKWALP